MVIAIDGPAGAGKSSVARAVARELGGVAGVEADPVVGHGHPDTVARVSTMKLVLLPGT